MGRFGGARQNSREAEPPLQSTITTWRAGSRADPIAASRKSPGTPRAPLDAARTICVEIAGSAAARAAQSAGMASGMSRRRSAKAAAHARARARSGPSGSSPDNRDQQKGNNQSRYADSNHDRRAGAAAAAAGAYAHSAQERTATPHMTHGAHRGGPTGAGGSQQPPSSPRAPPSRSPPARGTERRNSRDTPRHTRRLQAPQSHP